MGRLTNCFLIYLSSTSGRRSFYTYSAEPFHPLPGKTPAWKSPQEALEVIQSGDGVFLLLVIIELISSSLIIIHLFHNMAKIQIKVNCENHEPV